MSKRVYQYEAMFLLSQAVAADLSAATDHIKEVLARASAEIIALKKWDDRRLAYEIAGQKRGIYILAYFKAAGPDVAKIERDSNLSEKIMRVLILRADHLTNDEMLNADGRKELDVEAKLRSDKPATPGEVPAAAPANG